MPVYVQGSLETRNEIGMINEDYGYKYPHGLNLRPGSLVHDKLATAVRMWAQESYQVMSQRFPSWNKIDETLTAYIPADADEDDVTDMDDRKPVSIVVPYSYATLETLLTYLVAAYLQDPIFKYEGVSPEDTIGAMLLELTIASQCRRMKTGLQLHTMYRDALSYGIGACAISWSQEWGFRDVISQRPKFSLFGMSYGQEQVRETVEAMLFEGNELLNIDPYRFLPDPNYGIQDFQKGDFVGWIDTQGFVDLLDEERRGEGDIFNVKYLKHLSSRRTVLFSSDDSARERHIGGRSMISENIARPVDSVHMYAKIIPKDYGLPGGQFNKTGEYPEKWYFQLGADQILIQAKRMGLNHDRFPIVVCAPDYDGRTITPVSRLEIVYGLQHVLNFMFNSHVANVRKAINDMLIVDPFLINMNDLRSPKPGKLIRLRRSAWGKSGAAKEAVQQLQVTDITGNNIGDGAHIMDIMERVSGATHNMMGVMRPGSERRSATEFQGTQSSAMNRLERIARIVGLQAMQDIGYMFASHTQQLMSEDTYIKIVGEYEKELTETFGASIQKGRMKIRPDELLVEYDTIVRDGSVPGGNFSQAYVQMFQAASTSEFAASRIDLWRLFKWIMTQMGAKNVGEFELKRPAMSQMQTMPDQEVERQVQQGNLKPMMGANSPMGGNGQDLSAMNLG